FDGLLMKPFREKELLSLLSQDVDLEENPEEKQEIVEMDLSSLRKMTLNDEVELQRILVRFREDSLNDTREIQEALVKEEPEQIRLLVHRMAGRIAQIGSRKLAASFRQMEVDVAAEGLDKGKNDTIHALLQQLG